MTCHIGRVGQRGEIYNANAETSAPHGENEKDDGIYIFFNILSEQFGEWYMGWRDSYCAPLRGYCVIK